MPIFDPSESKHFCSGYAKGRTVQQSFRLWAKALPVSTRLAENSAAFDVFRDLSLGEIERLLALSGSHYRRAHDGFSGISSAWSYVTLYYGSFFAATALMGMFGVWLVDKRKILCVQRTQPSRQLFEARNYSSPTGAGSHGQFWELYYSQMATLSPFLSPAERFAVNVPSTSFDWQSDERNRVNYDTFEAFDLANQFSLGFAATSFPGSLPGVLSTQFQFHEAVLSLAVRYAKEFRLNTDAIDHVSALPDRKARVRDLVLVKRPRALGAKAKKRVFLG